MNKKDFAFSQAGKKNVHFNVIDALIIILLVAIVLGVYFRFNIVEQLKSEDNTDVYTVSFSVDNIRYTTPSYMSVGDAVYFADSGELFGVLISDSENQSVMSIMPASEIFIDSAGEIKEVYYDEDTRIDARGRIECKGIYTEEGGFCVNGTRYIAPGQTLEINTELVTINITVTSIDKAE